MSNRLWQSCMIWLARSSSAKRFFTRVAGGTQLARKFLVVGSARDAAIRMTGMRQECGALASLFYLGEYLYDRAAVQKTLQQQMAAAKALAEQGLEIHVSVDPTQIGLSIDRDFAASNAKAFGDLVCKLRIQYPQQRPRMMIDMEDHTTVEDTVQLHRAALAQGVPAAITLQAYLLRTMSDLRALTNGPNMVRLVKGAFVAGADVAYTRQEEILENYRALLREMFSPAARDAGFYPVVATHDPAMHQ